MKEQIEQLVESAKTDRKLLSALKKMSVEFQKYELACQLKDIDEKYYPVTDDIKEARLEANGISNVLSMVGLNVNPETCWIVAETMRVFNAKKGDFSLEDAAKIKVRTNEIFFAG